MRNGVGVILVFYISLSGAREVPSPPFIVKQPTMRLIFQDEGNKEDDVPFTLQCEAGGEPAPKYYWMKNGKPFEWQTYDDRISQQTGQGTLSISKPSDVDIGQYQCFAENMYGIATSNSVFIRKVDIDYLKTIFPATLVRNGGNALDYPDKLPEGWHWTCFYTNGDYKLVNMSHISLRTGRNVILPDHVKQNGTDNFVFACGATLINKRIYKYRDMVLHPISIEIDPPEHEPVLHYVTRNSTVAHRGERIQLFCVFGGNPPPETVWSKNGKPVQDPFQIMETLYAGTILTIEGVDFEDEGSYTCDVSNGIGEIKSHTINLSLLAAPYFTEEPERVVTSEGETIEFNCKAGGDPEPEINWIHNGKPIAEAPYNPRRKILKNKIIIEGLTLNDTGNYGCNATNNLGYIYKDAYVNVLALVPEIIEEPEDTQVVENGNVNITCRVQGMPKPNIMWIYDEKELTGERYQVQENGDLVINAAQVEDAGNYTCYAENRLGNTSATVKLELKARTYITDGPKYYEVKTGSSATLRCNAVADESLNLEILWLKHDQLIDFEAEPRYSKSSNYTLTIANTTELDSANYTCLAKTELDEVSAKIRLIIQDVPNPPAIRLVKCYAKIAKINWVPMGDNRAPILFYKIQYNTSFSPEEWIDAFSHIPVDEMTYNVPMSPWANYTFRVIAVNKIGYSIPSPPSDVCTTLADVPHKNPDNVKGEGNLPNSLVISWTPMPLIDHNAPGFKYRVYWKLLTAGTDYNYVEILDYKEDRLVIPNQSTFGQYRIKVIAVNEVGEAEVFPQEVIGYSEEDVPEKAPTNFTLLKILSPSTALLSWDPVPINSVRGRFKGYKILFWSETFPNIFKEMPIHATTSKVIIDRFEPHAINYAQVYVFNGKHDGPPSEILGFRTPEGVPDKIEDLKAIPLGSSAFLLKWNKPKEANGILTGYNIYCTEVNNSIIVHQPVPRISQVSDPNRLRVKIGGLKPDTKYRIYVTATTVAGESKKNFIERKTNPIGTIKPSEPRFEYDIIKNGLVASVRIYWIPNENGHAGSYFYVKYMKGSTQFVSEPQKNDDFAIISNLETETTYTFTVTSVDGVYHTDSEPKEIRT